MYFYIFKTLQNAEVKYKYAATTDAMYEYLKSTIESDIRFELRVSMISLEDYMKKFNDAILDGSFIYESYFSQAVI